MLEIARKLGVSKMYKNAGMKVSHVESGQHEEEVQ